MNTLNENIKKAMELVQTKKEEIANEKTKISIAEGRRKDNKDAIEDLQKQIIDFGFNPETLEEDIESLKTQLNENNKELQDIIAELEGEAF